MLGNDSHIWCPECDKVQPLLRDYMPAKGKAAPATDLLCSVCAFIIATIHHLSPSNDDIVRLRTTTGGTGS